MATVWDIGDYSASANPDVSPVRIDDNQTNGSFPPDEAIQSCQEKSIGDECQFKSKGKILTGVCDDKPGIVACAPDKDQIPAPPSHDKSISKDVSRTGNETYDSCINHTKDNPQCKDWCDCLAGTNSQTRTDCRDTCAVHDFSKNSNITSISVPSLSGPDGNYSQ